MDPLAQAFPDRPLTLRGAGLGLGAWLMALGGAVLAGAVVFLAWESVQGIRQDWSLAEAARPSPQARLVSGSCRSRLWLLQACDVVVAARDKGQPEIRRSLTYHFVEPHMGDWTTVALLDPARPDMPTTQLGQDRLLNRSLTVAGMLAFAPVFLLGGLAGLRQHWRLRARVAALSGQRLMPVAARLDEIGAGPVWWITAPGGPSSLWPVGRGDTPFFLDPARGVILALRAASGGEAYPLDAKLRRVALSTEERSRVMAIRAAG